MGVKTLQTLPHKCFPITKHRLRDFETQFVLTRVSPRLDHLSIVCLVKRIFRNSCVQNTLSCLYMLLDKKFLYELMIGPFRILGWTQQPADAKIQGGGGLCQVQIPSLLFPLPRHYFWPWES